MNDLRISMKKWNIDNNKTIRGRTLLVPQACKEKETSSGKKWVLSNVERIKKNTNNGIKQIGVLLISIIDCIDLVKNANFQQFLSQFPNAPYSFDYNNKFKPQKNKRRFYSTK